MNIVVIGKSGQVAWELSQLDTSHVITCLGRDDVDILSVQSLEQKLRGAEAVINTAAYTQVDLAESETEHAYQINAQAVKNIVNVCKKMVIPLVHISTDFVFDGKKSSPYKVDDDLSPLGVYGESKAAGEEFVRNILQDLGCIIRTSWVYSTHGNNFVKTMLRLMAEKSELGVVGDQVGTPTYAKDLANVCVFALENKLSGIYHWTDNGITSWYDFAIAIQELAIEKGLLDMAIPVNSIVTKDYPTPAKRPAFSVLDKSANKDALNQCKPIHWRKQLSYMLDLLISQK